MCSINELRHWRKLSLTLIGILLIPTLYAEETRNYQVEIVIFENLDPAAHQAEQWPTQVQLQLPAPIIELGSAADSKLGFRLLPSSSFKLNQDAQQLTDSHNFRVLLHTAWRQPGLEQQVALPVHLSKSIPANTQPVVAHEATAQTNTPAGNKQLDGYLKLMLSKYLHAEIDLIYHDTPTPAVTTLSSPAGNLPQSNPSGPVYHLKDIRKMRSKEMHYIDSPVLGMLIEVFPLQ